MLDIQSGHVIWKTNASKYVTSCYLVTSLTENYVYYIITNDDRIISNVFIISFQKQLIWKQCLLETLVFLFKDRLLYGLGIMDGCIDLKIKILLNIGEKQLFNVPYI